MKTQIQNCREHIWIRELSCNRRIRNANEKIFVLEDYLYEAYRRKDTETRDALVEIIIRK